MGTSTAAHRIGLVSRNLETKDYSRVLGNVLQLLDTEKCDVALFSLYSIDRRKTPDPVQLFPETKHLKMIVLEICSKISVAAEKREPKHVSVFIRHRGKWEETRLEQQFGTVNWHTKNSKIENLAGTAQVTSFVTEVLPQRKFLDNTCLFICGEINGVKYDKGNKAKGVTGEINDYLEVAAAVEKLGCTIILNPSHDKMKRHEMDKKRAQLSKNRWLVSVWNKSDDKPEGGKPSWQVWHNGKAQVVGDERIINGIEIGIVSIPE